MNTTKMINEKPCTLSNLGEEVFGAKRHAFDTYDNPEKAREKAQAKKLKDNRKSIKEDAINALDESNYVEVLRRMEMKLTLEKIQGYSGLSDGSTESMNELKDYVVSIRDTDRAAFNAYADAFNRLSRCLTKIRYRVRSLSDAEKYLGPKKREAFKEFNGIKGAWILGAGETFDSSTTEKLSRCVRAVQFGNSVPVSEREYCLKNLLESIELLNKHYHFDFKNLAFSFGARGKAGSIAHYQDSQKVLAFNRGWIGAFIHELGHAVDYSLEVVSDNMPYSIRTKYYTKINAIKDMSRTERHYYTETKEIFARLFEVYLREKLPGMNAFMQVTFSDAVMPDLDDESRAWMDEILESSKACHFNESLLYREA